MYNPHAYAITLEHFLYSKGYCLPNEAANIVNDPFAYLELPLDYLSNRSSEDADRVYAFDQKYESCKGKSLRDIDENTAKAIVEDFKALYK